MANIILLFFNCIFTIKTSFVTKLPLCSPGLSGAILSLPVTSSVDCFNFAFANLRGLEDFDHHRPKIRIYLYNAGT